MKKIEARNIYKKFQNLEVLKGIDLEVNEGEVVAVIGPSGGGKSTLLRCLNKAPSSSTVKPWQKKLLLAQNTLPPKILDVSFVKWVWCSNNLTCSPI